MALKTYERQDSIERGGFAPATGLRAVADSWNDVGKAAGEAQQRFYKEGVEYAEQEGKKEGERAIWTDPNTGKPQIVGTLPEGSRPYAKAYRDAAEARYTAELGLSSLTKAAEIAEANSGNPEGFRHAWQGHMDGIVESVPEAIRPSVDFLLKQRGTQYYYKMQQEDFERTKSEAKVSTMNLADALERDHVDLLRASGLAGGSPEFMETNLQQMRGLMDDQVARGVISPEEGNARVKDYEFRLMRGMLSGEAIKMAKEGKADKIDKMLEEFRQTPSDRVDDYQRNQISDYARGEVTTYLAQAKATATAAMEAAKRQVKDAQDVWWKGENYALDDRTMLRVAEATGDPAIIADTQAALAARTSIHQFSLLSPQNQATALVEMEGQDGHTGDTLKLKEKLQTIYKETETALDSGDTLQLATRRGLIAADPIDWSNPATLQKRAEDVAQVDSSMGVASNPLLPAEKDQLVKLFDGFDSEGKMALYGTLKKDMGEDLALRAMGQLGQDRPALAYAMGMSDDDPGVARQILMGDLALQADKSVLAGASDLDTTFNSYIGAAVKDDDVLRNAMRQSATALFAERVKRGQADPTDTSDFEAAIETVTGGLADINDHKTIVPKRGMSGGDFEDLTDGLTDAQIRQTTGGNKLVTLSGEEVPAHMVQSKGIFEWMGDGQYILKLRISDTLNGQTVFMADDKGAIIKDQWGRPIPAEMDFKPLVGG